VIINHNRLFVSLSVVVEKNQESTHQICGIRHSDVILFCFVGINNDQPSRSPQHHQPRRKNEGEEDGRSDAMRDM